MTWALSDVYLEKYKLNEHVLEEKHLLVIVPSPPQGDSIVEDGRAGPWLLGREWIREAGGRSVCVCGGQI